MRRQSRELALQMLFQYDFAQDIDNDVLIKDFFSLFEHKMELGMVEYARKISAGYLANNEAIDSIIQKCSKNWKLNRMPLVDKNLARISTFEMKFSDEIIQPQVAINEALEIAKKYGTNDSSSFLNGVLDCISKSQF